MEVLVVIAIILILTSAVGFMAVRYIGRARQVTARNQIETISLALNAYALDCQQYPTREQGLEALWLKPVLEPLPAGWDGPYVSKRIPVDPWNRLYEYVVPGPNGLPYGIRSFGADGQEGGEGEDRDVASWES